MPEQSHHAAAASDRRTSTVHDDSRRTTDGEPQIAASSSSRGGAGCKSKTRAVDAEKGSSTGTPAVYDASADIEVEYRLFLEHARVYENEDFVVEYGGRVISYGAEAGADGGSREPPAEAQKKEKTTISSDESPAEATIRTSPKPLQKEKRVKGKGKKVEKNNNIVVPLKIEDDHLKVVDNVPQQKAKRDKKSKKKELQKNVNIVDPRIEDGRIQTIEKVQIVVALEKPRTGTSLANRSDGHNTTSHKSRTTTIVTNPSDGPEIEPHMTSESPGVIWPTHINEREESEFKHRLIGALSKPFSQEEYDKLYGMPSIRNPPMKERQTRSGVKAYKCPHGIGKSYFDHYPDLAEQVENTSCSNRLALLRGLFFWLENVAHEHQFRPWSNDNKCLKVIYL